jgi:hypothetical protein
VSLLYTLAIVAAGGASAHGDYVWPLSLEPQLTSSFAEYRPGRFHAGIDLRTAGVGRDVFAAGDGYISRVRCSPYGYGKAVYLQLSDGNVAVYAHLSDYYDGLADFVHQEQRRRERYTIDVHLKPSQFPVSKGQLIAKSGQTGIGAPHLHFEMRDAAHEPVNPRLLGYTWPDNVAPSVKQILIAPKGLEGRVDGDILPVVLPVTRDESGVLRTRPIHVAGMVSLGADLVDPGSGGYKLGIHQLRLHQDSEEVFRMQHDRLSYTNHRNGAVAYHPHMRHEGRFLLLWRWPGNRCHSYRQHKGDGWATVSPDAGEFVIETTDFHGNTARVIVPITHTAPAPQPIEGGRAIDMNVFGPELMITTKVNDAAAGVPMLQTNPGGESSFTAIGGGTYRSLFRPARSGLYTLKVSHPALSPYQREVAAFLQGQPTKTVTLGDVQISAGPDAPYGALFLRAWKVDSPPAHAMPARSAAYQIWPSDAPIFDSVTISVPLNDGAKKGRNVHIYRYRGSYWSREDTAFRNGRAEIETRTAGIFMAMEDNEAPKLSKILPTEGYTAQSERPLLRADVTDNGSGIAGYRITCGSRWLVGAYDPERNRLSWERDEDLPAGRQVITFTLTDRAGNTKVVTRNIVVPE